jgi:hypothetical protein
MGSAMAAMAGMAGMEVLAGPAMPTTDSPGALLPALSVRR